MNGNKKKNKKNDRSMRGLNKNVNITIGIAFTIDSYYLW
jgi:hypothetical protein